MPWLERYRVTVVAIILMVGMIAERSLGETYSVQGSKIDVRLVPEKATILFGEPIYLHFSIENLSDRKLQLIVGKEYIPGAHNRSRFELSAVRDNGLRVVKPPPPDLNLPYNARIGPHDLLTHQPYVFELFLTAELPFTEPGNYTIHCMKLLEFIKPLTDNGRDDHAKPEQVMADVSALLSILPANPEGMKQVIERLGQTAIMDFKDDGHRQEEAWRASTSLAAIADERAIPWLIKLLGCGDSTRKSQALDGLAQFNDVEAFGAIISGLATRGADIEGCTTAQVAAETARAIHLDAVRALIKSRYPGALSFVQSLRHDPDENIRLQIVHAFGQRSGAEADSVLQEMSHDRNKMVGDEATRYLKLHTAQNPQ